MALSIQYEPIADLGTRHIWELWSSRLQPRYTEVEEHQPLPPVFELPQSGMPGPAMRFEVAGDLPQPRYWFLNPAGTELLQMQPDRLIVNWRRISDRDSYPRFEAVRDRMEGEVQTVNSFLHEKDLGAIVPNQCEVTYVNEIKSGQGWRTFSDIGKVISIVSSRYAEPLNPGPESVKIAMPFPIIIGGEFSGRLHVSIESALRADSRAEVLLMTLTARLLPAKSTVAEALAALDVGREHVVRAFAALTTGQMHKIWGRRDGS